MPGNNKPDEKAQNEGGPEQLIYDAMQSLGWLVPLTPEEVARAEMALALDPVELPESLRDPAAILDEQSKERTSFPCPAGESAAAEQLARVAREGGAIPPEVEARIRKDRERAERQQ
jgi:hypothetical protein